MAIYSYACTSCDNAFEIMKPMSRSDSAEVCPDCKAPLKKLITAPGALVFKGSGFFCNDYGKKSKPSEE